MSSTYLCLDCERPITFLNVVRDPRMVPSQKWFGNPHHNTITYVRCSKCIDEIGKLPGGENPLTSEQENAHMPMFKKLGKSITTFMKVIEGNVAGVTNDPIEEGGRQLYMNVDEAVESYEMVAPCVSLDSDGVVSAYRDFLVPESIPEPVDTGMNFDPSFNPFETILTEIKE